MPVNGRRGEVPNWLRNLATFLIQFSLVTETSIEKRASWLDFPMRGIRWNTETLLTIIILVLAVVSRFYDLGARTASHDEVNHFVPSYDFYQGRGYRYDPLSHGPLQFHLIALSFTLFGDSDFTARIPAAVFSIVTIGVALFAFRRYLGRVGALAAGGMLLISPYMLFYGRYARNEIFIVLWGLLTIYTILRYLERGEPRTLILFTLVNALHFTDKATSYIFAAEQLLFLAVYFLDRIIRREWPLPKYRQAFLLALSAMLALLAAAAGLYLTGKPLASAMLTLIVALGLGGLFAGILAGIALVRGLDCIRCCWAGVRSERSFDLLMLLGTLVLPLLAGIPVKLAGFNPLDYSPAGIWRSVIAIAVLMVIAVLLGLWWNRRAWPLLAILFYGIFTILYTTFFTNPKGLAGGFMGALSYWLGQQTVNRGGQPWFYYGLFQIPLYEFLPAFGTFAAVVIAFRKRLWQAQPGQPFTSNQASASADQPMPTLLLVVYWSLINLVAFTVAGEKMPWLTIHIALPLILGAAWAVGWLVETTPWGNMATWNWKHDLRVIVLACMGFLAVLTFRASYRAAYINYDYPFEYLVYAHSAPDPKVLLGEIEEISRRTTGGLDIVVAYDNNVRYPYWWYLRRYPNRIDFDVNPTSDLRRAAIIVVTPALYDKITVVVRDNYVTFDSNRLWWPNMDYWNLKWDWIDSEYRLDLGADAPPMNLGEYLLRVWGHIRPFFTDPKVRSAIWQIWFNRDYTQYAALKQSNAFTLTNWNTVERMRVYIRKDIAAQIWSHGLAAQEAVVADPYASVTVQLTPDQDIGATGSGAGQFQSPRAIAVAPDGSLYVADSLNHRIQHLSPNGEVLQVWGQFGDVTQGDAPGGMFNEPWGVAVAPDGTVYVADTWNYRVQKFSADGQFLSMWQTFSPADKPEVFYGPRGIAVDSHRRVFVVDTGNKRVVVFEADGRYLTQFGGAGLGPGQMDEPVGIALDGDGDVYVTDTWNKRVQVFAPDASGLNYTPVAEWLISGWYGQSVQNKPFIAVDAQKHVYVTDPQACRVLEFTASGQIVRAWGACSSDVNGFGLPIGLAVDAASGVWVSDAGNNRLLHFP
jgi:predicted membrane-bound mannosyltransferase/DNA-binding beta-propeller fold protein YncE